MTLIREPLLRGVREVSAILFAGPTAADDVLVHWAAGATLLRTGDGALVVRFATPTAWRCELGKGVPLIADEGRLVSLPLDRALLEATPPDAIVRLHHGRLAVEETAPSDPTGLLDLSTWHLEAPTAVTGPQPGPESERGQRPPPPDPSMAVTPADFDTSAKLGRRSAPTARDRRQWRLLQPRPTRPAGPIPTTTTDARPTPGRPSGRTRTTSPLLDWLQKRRQRKYLDDLTRLFAAGDLDAALRKAIPFGGENGPAATRTPRPRANLEIKPRRTPASGIVSIEPGLRAELDHRYRSAFGRLDSEGRTLDAAFVLADLLNRTEEACRYLEQKGEVGLAAELAEARSTDHAEVVRLWWRAGRRDRAVAIARRHGCFAAAISRLERRGDRPDADRLRRLWMAQLLDAGDIVGAYDVGAKVDDALTAALRHRLIELGTEQGGPLGARMLARQLRAHDDAPHPNLAPLVAERSRAQEREILVKDLTADRSPVDHPQVVRSLVRQLLAESASIDRDVIDAAVTLTGDPVLRTDLPPRAAFDRRTTSSLEAAWIEVDSTDRGQLLVKDARLLPDGRLIVAIDGVGIRLHKPSGRTEAELDVPADVLIPSDNGLRVLALRSLGDGVFAVAAIAVPERRVRQLGEVAATRWADTYDGANWFLANQGQLWMLDMLADGPVALWRQTEHREPILAVSRAPGELAVASIVTGSGDMAPWTVVRHYRLPGLVSFETRDVAVTPGVVLLPNGEVAVGDAASGPYRARVEGGGTETLTVLATRESIEAPVAVLRLAGATRAALHLDNGSLVVSDDCGRVEAVDLDSGARRSLRLTL